MRILFLLLGHLVVMALPVHAGETLKVMRGQCGVGGGNDVWVFLEADDGTCSETSIGVFECWEPGNDYAKASCDTGCERVEIENFAGCWMGPVPSAYDLFHTVKCGNNGGRTFDLKGVEGDTCNTNTDGEGKVTGGQCSQTDSGGNVHISSAADCDTGCTTSSPPGDCTER